MWWLRTSLEAFDFEANFAVMFRCYDISSANVFLTGCRLLLPASTTRRSDYTQPPLTGGCGEVETTGSLIAPHYKTDSDSVRGKKCIQMNHTTEIDNISWSVDKWSSVFQRVSKSGNGGGRG